MTQLYPCLSAQAIQQVPEIRPYINALPQLISAPREVYAQIYHSVLNCVMELCQALPWNFEQPKPYGLLAHQFQIALNALKLRRGKMLPLNADSETSAEQEPLWTYAVFTLGLFHQLDVYFQRITVDLYQSETAYLGRWNRITGTLFEPVTFYSIASITSSHNPPDTKCPWAMMLGRLMPALGLRWLSSEPSVFSCWWDCLFDPKQTPNPLRDLITTALDQMTSSEN